MAGPLTMTNPFDNIPVETLEKILANSGQFMSQELRSEVISRIASCRQQRPSDWYLLAAHDVAKASRYAQDWSQRAQGTYDVSGWCQEFKQNSEAVNEVLQYLQAQMSMDLFNHNPRAKRVFEHIIKSGIEATIFNRTDGRLGDPL